MVLLFVVILWFYVCRNLIDMDLFSKSDPSKFRLFFCCRLLFGLVLKM